MKTAAVILAAGQAKRMKAGTNKLFLRLREPIIIHTLQAFEANSLVNDIILVVNENEKGFCENELKRYKFNKIKKLVSGGEKRQDSSYNGVFAADADIILIHDGARPFVSQECITESIEDAMQHGASVVAVPAKDTIKKASGIFVDETLDRGNLWIIQTPQTFKADVIREAHKKAREDGFVGTDDASLTERLGYKVKITMGHYDNIKITTPDDLLLAEKILKQNEVKNV